MSSDTKATIGIIAGMLFVFSTIGIARLAADETERLPMAEKGCYVEVTKHNRLFGEDTQTIKEFCETRKDKR